MIYFRYGIPRAFRSLVGNWRASLNNTLILAASLSVAGMIVLLHLNVVQLSAFWLSNTTASLFLEPNLSLLQREALLKEVTAHPLVRSARIVTPEDGLRELAARLQTRPEVLAAAGDDTLPYTIDFDVFVDYRDRMDTLASQFRALEGVEEVVYTERLLERVEVFFSQVRAIGWFFIALILLSFLLVVAHATRLSLYARREEIEILTLVGATRRFVRSSFVVEGALIAALGCVVATVIVWASYTVLIAALTWNPTTEAIREHSVFLPLDAIGVAIAACAALGALSSRIAVNRLLRELES